MDCVKIAVLNLRAKFRTKKRSRYNLMKSMGLIPEWKNKWDFHKPPSIFRWTGIYLIPTVIINNWFSGQFYHASAHWLDWTFNFWRYKQ